MTDPTVTRFILEKTKNVYGWHAYSQAVADIVSGKVETAQEINKKLMPLHDALFCETSPGPLKYAASLMGICSSEARLPIVDIEDSSKENVKIALKKADLI